MVLRRLKFWNVCQWVIVMAHGSLPRMQSGIGQRARYRTRRRWSWATSSVMCSRIRSVLRVLERGNQPWLPHRWSFDATGMPYLNAVMYDWYFIPLLAPLDYRPLKLIASRYMHRNELLRFQPPVPSTLQRAPKGQRGALDRLPASSLEPTNLEKDSEMLMARVCAP